MKQQLKKWLPDGIAILLFITAAFVYFLPAVIDGREIAQHDHTAFVGAGQEVQQFKAETGETSRWTNSLFGGMPTYQSSPSYPSNSTLKAVGKVYSLFLPNYVWLVFVMLTGFYILMRALKMSVWLSVLGAFIWAFSSYFFIIITAGHIWKFITLAYIPPTIAGIVLAYRGKYLLGGVVVALFFALQIMSNHVQMTYYFLFVIGFMVLAYLEEAIRTKQVMHFIKASAVVLTGFAVGTAINASNLYHTYEYSKETMRGKSELKKDNTENQTSSGLERDYITQWSYGIDETFTLLIPNTKGGASVPISDNETAMQKADSQFSQIYSQIPQYWGEQPGTSGPVYVGAFVCMLFVLGCFVVRGPMKWALVEATVFSILLSWGKNFMGLTDFFIDYVPMYAKFRTVASILVIAEFTIPLLAILALKEIITRPETLREKPIYFYLSFGFTGGLALLFALFPQMFFSSFISSDLKVALETNLPAEYVQSVMTNLTDMCIGIFTADAWRSFFIILLGSVLLYLFIINKLKAKWMVIAITVLCVADMWSVNKRYLSDKDFVEPTRRMAEVQKTPTDEVILADTAKDFRVLNFAGNTFNENNTSYWHKSIGGYHAAKLRRYQELIEYHISTEMQYLMKTLPQVGGDMTQVDADSMKVVNMLNTRYFIFPVQGGTVPLQNPHAYGNAWFTDEVQYVPSANAEIEALYNVSPKKTAIVNERYKSDLQNAVSSPSDSTATIRLTEYKPNYLRYETNSAGNRVAVFSEVYYKQWQAYIDGKEVPIACANYVLRALHVPSGKHVIEFRFDPPSIHTTEIIAYVGLVALLLIMGYLLYSSVKRKN